MPHLLSTIDSAPTSYFVYSSFSFFGRHSGWELPGGWFVEALGEAGRAEPVVRQTLYRMVKQGELEARKEGRTKVYSPTAYARAEIEAGTSKLLDPAFVEWDGEWTVVHLGAGSLRMEDRGRIESLMQVEGFGALDRSTFIHPRPIGDRLLGALHDRSRGSVFALRGASLAAECVPALVARLWDVAGIAARYRAVIHALEQVELELNANPISGRDAFLLRFAVVFEYLRVAWDDPELPPTVLTADWPAERARSLAARLYLRLLPDAIAFAESVASGGESAKKMMSDSHGIEA